MLCFRRQTGNVPPGDMTMNIELNSSLAEQTKNSIAPVQDMNRLIVDKVEKLVTMQIASAQRYSALGLANLKAFMDIKDADTLQAYIGKQGDLIKSVSEQLMSDAKTITELGRDFGEQVQKIGQKEVKETTKKAKAVTKKAA
jgi:phasin family protein